MIERFDAEMKEGMEGFSVICDRCKSFDVDIMIYPKMVILYCNSCRNDLSLEVEATMSGIEDFGSLVGVTEAAALLGWDKRKVSLYDARARKYRDELDQGLRNALPAGIFPAPIVRLASGPVWRRQQILDFKERYVKSKEGKK